MSNPTRNGTPVVPLESAATRKTGLRSAVYSGSLCAAAESYTSGAIRWSGVSRTDWGSEKEIRGIRNWSQKSREGAAEDDEKDGAGKRRGVWE